MKKTIEQIIEEKLEEKYRKKLNATKALNKSNEELNKIFMDFAEQTMQGLNNKEKEIGKMIIKNIIKENFIKEDEFLV